MKIRVIDPEKDNITPKCPHCKEKLDEIFRITDRREKWHEGLRGHCFICPHCEVILGFSSQHGMV